MAFGLSPKYIQNQNLDNLDQESFLAFAIEAACKLGWSVRSVSRAGCIAYTKFPMSSWGEEVTIKIGNGVANIKSECSDSQIIGWGKTNAI